MVTRVRPTDLAGLAEAVREGRRVRIAGAGTASGWGAEPSDVDVVLDTTGLDGVIDYRPADMTVAVRAGTPLATLQQVLAGQGQRVALDAGRIPLGATVGGLLATADGGPARQAYGTLRDTVIGITVVLADGTIARSGGQVIKNVAGYDLAKLFHGSLGTLGVVAEVVLRVYPVPEQTRTVAVAGSVEDGFAAAGRLVAGALEPAALEWFDGRLLVRFEGTAAGVARRAAESAGVAAAGTESPAKDSPATECPAKDSAAGAEAGAGVWQEVAAVAVGEPGDTVLRVGTLPSLAPWFASRLAVLAGEHAVAAALSSSLGVGVHTVRLRSGDPAGHDRVLAVLRDEVAARGGNTTVIRRAGRAPAWGPPPPAVALLRAVKRQFDPDGRLGPGRFAPWF